MGHYLSNFAVYTMAMTGLICFAVIAYKKLAGTGFSANESNILKVEETLNINPRKSLMIVRAGNERFLVASDVDKTALISRLGMNQKQALPAARNTQRNVTPVAPCNERVQRGMLPAKQPRPVQKQEKMENLDNIYPKNRMVRPAQKNPQAMKQKGNSVVLDFSKSKDHGLGSIREMAKKINEL